MARIRTIKPEFFTSEDIVELDPLARLLYIALWCEADKEGRLSWKPKTFKMRYLPADDCNIDAICDALLTRGLVVAYGEGLAYIPSFKSHQHINPREKESTLPPPTLESTTRVPRVSDASVTSREEGKGREGKGREGNDLLSEQSPDKPKRKHGSEEDHKVARWMFERIQKIDATAKEPNWDGWANDIRLMREIDERDHKSICDLFDWASRDAFWCSNILSPGKLREQWTKLSAQRSRGGQSLHGRHSAMNSIGVDDQIPAGFNGN